MLSRLQAGPSGHAGGAAQQTGATHAARDAGKQQQQQPPHEATNEAPPSNGWETPAQPEPPSEAIDGGQVGRVFVSLGLQCDVSAYLKLTETI